jgi:putative spermidine/putrescine transport system permease protein
VAQLTGNRPLPATSVRRRQAARGGIPGGGIVLSIILIAGVIYLILPLLVILGFSLAQAWSKTVLPDGYTVNWYREAVADSRFSPTVTRTLKVVVATSILSPLIVTPAVIYVHLKAPRLKPWLEFLSIIPWALPGVVLALAMIRAYISPYNVNKPFLLVMSYVLISLPFMFRAIDSGLSAINARTLVEAAQVLGAGWLDVTRRVLIPNIMTGILSGALLVCALASGEYALANLMVGSGWKTFPIYQAQAQGEDGRIASALVVMGLVFTFGVSMILIYLTTRDRRGRNTTVTAMANR